MKFLKFYPKQEVERGEEIFRVEGLSKTGYYKDVSFSLHKGEILAMTGLVGAGRTEVCQGIMGIERPDKRKGHFGRKNTFNKTSVRRYESRYRIFA